MLLTHEVSHLQAQAAVAVAVTVGSFSDPEDGDPQHSRVAGGRSAELVYVGLMRGHGSRSREALKFTRWPFPSLLQSCPYEMKYDSLVLIPYY